MIFVKPRDLIIIENDMEFILRKGVIHVNELIIDKLNSSNEFVSTMKKFIKDKNISINEEDDVFEDFMQLLKFSLIQIAAADNYLIICNNALQDDINKTISDDNVVVESVENILSIADISSFTEKKKPLTITKRVRELENYFERYTHIYYIDFFNNVSSFRAWNSIMHTLEKECTFGIIDAENIYLTGVKYNYTGCYECLEKHIISKFPGKISDYLEDFIHEQTIGSPSDLHMLLSFIMRDMANISIYGDSSLTGNVIHMFTPTFEYSFNANRKHSGCLECAGINNVFFDEQYMKSINIIKEVNNNAKHS